MYLQEHLHFVYTQNSVPYLLDLCRTLELCHTAVLFERLILVSKKNVNCTAPSNSTVPYCLYTLITSAPVPEVRIHIHLNVRKK